jgi:hypothetical protein
MATSDNGLWDNEKSLKALPGMVKVPAPKDLTQLLVSWGLRLWFGQCEPREFARAIERKAKDVVKLPKPVYNEIASIAQRPDAFRKGVRKPEFREVIGSAGDGYRVSPIFDIPEARAQVTEVAEKCASRLDTATRKKVTFAEEPLPELGVLLEMTNIGLYQAAERVEAWKKGFNELNARTKENRELWDAWVARVEKVFPLLVKP